MHTKIGHASGHKALTSGACTRVGTKSIHLGQELIPLTALLLGAQGSARNRNSNLAFQGILKITSVKIGG